MRRIADQQHPTPLKMLGDQLRRLPMRDVDDLDREIWFSYSLENKVVTTFGGVVLRRSFLRWSVLEQKHAAIAIGDQEKPPKAWLIDQDRIRFVASDELTPIGSKVDKDVVLTMVAGRYRRAVEPSTSWTSTPGWRTLRSLAVQAGLPRGDT